MTYHSDQLTRVDNNV